jgi:hypothetical protein
MHYGVAVRAYQVLIFRTNSYNGRRGKHCGGHCRLG